MRVKTGSATTGKGLRHARSGRPLPITTMTRRVQLDGDEGKAWADFSDAAVKEITAHAMENNLRFGEAAAEYVKLSLSE